MEQVDNLQSRDTYVNALAESLFNGQSLAAVPGLVKQIIKGDMWKERVVQKTKKVVTYKRFAEFVEDYPPEGLHTNINMLIRICKDYQDMEAVDLLAKAIGGKGGNNNPDGVNQHTQVNHNNIIVDQKDNETKQGTSAAYTMRRLAKDFPTIHERVLTGELSPNKAALEAGFRQPKLQIPADPTAAGRYLAQRVDDAWMLELYDAYMKAQGKEA